MVSAGVRWAVTTAVVDFAGFYGDIPLRRLWYNVVAKATRKTFLALRHRREGGSVSRRVTTEAILQRSAAEQWEQFCKLTLDWYFDFFSSLSTVST